MDLLSEVSSETIGIFGVSSTIFLVTKLFTSISPLLTGVLSDLIFFVRPLALSSSEIFPAYKKISIKFSTSFLRLI